MKYTTGVTSASGDTSVVEVACPALGLYASGATEEEAFQALAGTIALWVKDAKHAHESGKLLAWLAAPPHGFPSIVIQASDKPEHVAAQADNQT